MHDLIAVKGSRIRNLFRMDLRRMLHGKAFYVMIVVAIYLPIMMITQIGGDSSVLSFIQGNGSFESFGTLLVSMSNVLAGILLCIYIGQEYSSGFIKNIATVHANKFDYILSKGLIALICNVVFTIVYLLAIFVAGAIMGMDASIPSIFGLVWYVIEKLILSIPMSLLIISINLLFRDKFGICVITTFFAAMGIVVKLIQMVLGFLGLDGISKVLNFTVTGASTFITMSPDISILLIVVIAVVWSLLFALVANHLMSRRDIL
ncbi:MAG: ABC transporter permease [Candidatus Faecivicinus sp.]